MKLIGRLGCLDLVEVDDASELAGDFFRLAFRAELPKFPRHFVLLRRGPEGETTIGYVHYTRNGNAYLAGGLAVSALEFRRLDARTAELVRREGGFAEWTMRTSCRWMDDADAVFAYMGDTKSIRINERVGFRYTGRRYLFVLWNRELAPEERESLVDRIAALGPF